MERSGQQVRGCLGPRDRSKYYGRTEYKPAPRVHRERRYTQVCTSFGSERNGKLIRMGEKATTYFGASGNFLFLQTILYMRGCVRYAGTECCTSIGYMQRYLVWAKANDYLEHHTLIR
jgi:hypothetical protein